MISLGEQSNGSSNGINGSPTGDTNQLLSVTLALKDLNRSLPQDRQIKLIIFLYSKFSEKSDMLIKALPQECRQFFYYICIDNKSIREKILNSTTMKITEVPCIIVIDVNDTISTYEGDRSIEIIKTIHSINKKHQLSKHGPNCQCPVHKQDQMEQKSSSVTQLTDLLGEEQERPQPSSGNIGQETGGFPPESKRLPRRNPIPEKMPIPRDRRMEDTRMERDEDVTDMGNLIDDSDDRMNAGVRSKIRGANRPMEMRIPEQDPPEVGISSARNYPMKGIGHEGLARSSLSQIPPQKPQQRQQIPIQIAGGEMLDDELDDMLDEDPTMDPQIRESMNSGKNGYKPDRKETMDSVKKAAAEMAKMREMEEDD